VQGQLLAQLLRFEDDPDGDVRWQVVVGLPGLAGEQPAATHPAVEALVRRLADPDSQVRDWAAFGLGLLDETDSPEIRQALLELLNDPEGDTAGEAAVALALRHDPRVLPVVLAELAHDDVGNLWVEAAGALADPRLLPALLRLQAHDWARHDPLGHLLAEAIDRVSPRPSSPARPDHDPGRT
jgi:HEAT repeat protein